MSFLVSPRKSPKQYVLVDAKSGPPLDRDVGLVNSLADWILLKSYKGALPISLKTSIFFYINKTMDTVIKTT